MPTLRPTLAPSAAPSNAIRMWCDQRAIYVEIPNPRGMPHISTFTRNESGLSKALAILCVQRFEFAGAPMIKPAMETPAQANLRKILRDTGIL